MQGFLTGATGFRGSFLVPELINARHHVVGPSRSDASAEGLNHRFITSVGAAAILLMCADIGRSVGERIFLNPRRCAEKMKRESGT